MEKKKMLSGITSTGKLTIGNYFGAIKSFVKNQENYNLYAFIANLHGITLPIDNKILNSNIKEMLMIYKACGLDYKKSNIYLQSDISAIGTLNWILTCQTTIGELSRMTQYKDKSSKIKSSNNTNFIPTGILMYPILMAADILMFSPDLVPVGIDQKQHVELTRNIGERFNNKFGETFNIPEFSTPDVGCKIMDLQDPSKKMSKSSDNKKSFILILDDLNDVRKKISSAVTDSENIVRYDIDNKPGVSNLITIYAAAKDLSIKEAENQLKDKNYKEFKDCVADAVCDVLKVIQDNYNKIKYEEIVKDLKSNAEKLNIEANKKLEEVLKKVGLAI